MTKFAGYRKIADSEDPKDFMSEAIIVWGASKFAEVIFYIINRVNVSCEVLAAVDWAMAKYEIEF